LRLWHTIGERFSRYSSERGRQLLSQILHRIYHLTLHKFWRLERDKVDNFMSKVFLLLGYISCWYLLNVYVHDYLASCRSAKEVLSVNEIDIVAKDTHLPPLVTNTRCDKEWRGHFSVQPFSRSAIVLVVSFCAGQLETLFANVRQQELNIGSILVFSKCNTENVPRQFLDKFEGVAEDRKTIVSLPNVGRVDHNIAHYIAHNSSQLDTGDVVLFVKDNHHIVHQTHMETAPLSQVVEMAAGDLGFACGLISRVESPQFSVWHETSKLVSFQLQEYESTSASYSQSDTQNFSTGETFGTWLENLKIVLPTPLTPVCYGGTFAVRSDRLKSARNAAERIERSLQRGDNIIEGHFAERTWAGLLMAELPRSFSDAILSMHVKTEFEDPARPGMLVGCASVK